MLGLSVSDRNLRRLLDAVKGSPHAEPTFALLIKPHWGRIGQQDAQRIDEKAHSYFERWASSGVKTPDVLTGQLDAILHRMGEFDLERENDTLRRLGVRPIWYDNHADVPPLLHELAAGGAARATRGGAKGRATTKSRRR
jgi:hypothetical protein